MAKNRRVVASVDTQAKTSNGVLINDPARYEKPANEWTDAELTAWGLYELSGTPTAPNAALAEEARERFKYPAAWTVDNVRQALEGTIPAKTISGLWVEDLTREARMLDEWTKEELKALYLGQINSKYKGSSIRAFMGAIRDLAKAEGYDAKDWTSDELTEWLAKGTLPSGEVEEEAPLDPLPPESPAQASELSVEALKAWAAGDLSYQADLSVDALIQEVRARNPEAPLAWSDNELVTFYGTGKEPPKTKSGVWLNDRDRDVRPYDEWMLSELRAWGKGEILPKRGDESLAQWLRDNIGEVDDGWTTAAIKRWAADGKRPAYNAEYDLLIEDRTRETREIDTWPKHEIVAVIKKAIRVSPTLYKKVFDHIAREVVPASNWTEKDTINAYLNEGYKPAITSTGINVTDPTRDKKQLTAWTAEELRAAALKEIKFPFSRKDLASTIRRYGSYPDQVADDVVIDLFAKGESAAYTSHGLLVQDSGRERLPAKRWSREELRAHFEGELPATEAAPPEDLVEAGYKALGFPVEWTYAQAVAYYQHAAEPPKTEGGVWVEARRREMTGTTTQDLQVLAAWAKHEISLDTALINQIQVPLVVTFGLYGLTEVQLIEFLWNLKPSDIYKDGFNRDVLLRYLPATQWKPQELRRFVKGELKATEYVSADSLMAQTRKVFEVPTSVKDVDVADYLLRQDTTQLTSNGLLVKDPEREFKPANEWSRAELIAYAQGEIALTKGVTRATLRKAYIAQFDGIEEAWSMDQVLAYVAKGTYPPKTSTGVWVVDITRSARYVGDWSEEELRSVARGEFAPPENVTVAQAIRAMRIKFSIPDKWTDTEALRFVARGEQPERATKIMADDPVRERKLAKQWTDAELAAWLKGSIRSSYSASDAQLMVVARKRFDFPEAWNDEQVTANFRTGAVPPRTSNGVWVIDAARDRKPADKWTLSEMQAWAMGEVKPSAVASGKALLVAARTYIQIRHDPEVVHWSDQEVHAWLKTGRKPTKTPTGLYKNDPLREIKIAIEWGKLELVAYLKGEILSTRLAGEADLHQAILIKWSIPAAWNEQEVKEYVLFDRVPAKTSNGLWVSDRVRSVKPAAHWNVRELKAWALDEIKPTARASSAALLEEIRIRFGVSKNMSAALVKQLLTSMKEDTLSMANDFIEQNLEGYAENMAVNKKSSELEWAAQQTLLYNTIQRVLKLEEREFTDGWTALLDFVNENLDTLFTPKNAFRGYPQLRMSEKDSRNFEQLLNLLLRTANPETRYAEAKNTNFGMALREISNERVRQQILSYYSVG